jgi:hypothetical protein
MGSLIVEFEDWEKVLKNTVSVPLQAGCRAAIVKFRYWLMEKGRAANVEAFKEYLALEKETKTA